MAEERSAETHAFVVGIEQYDAGPNWNLNGPAGDAVRFLDYLRKRGVPKQNLNAYLAPLPANAELEQRARSLAATVGQPSQAVIDNLVEKMLPPLKASLLLFFWAGHGLITLDDQRRLYTADATPETKRNLDLNEFMAVLRSDRYPHLLHQAIIVDACANYIPNPAANLAHHTYAAGAGMPDKEQFAIYAASPGEYAKNLTAERSGLLSRELMAILEQDSAHASWPPDFTAVAEGLASRFIELREQGKSRQTPATFWFRSPTRSGHFLAKFDVKTGSGPAARPQRALGTAEYKALLEGFLKLHSLNGSAAARDYIVRRLRPDIATTINRGTNARSDVIAIIDRCRSYNALDELLDCVNLFEADSAAMKALLILVHQLLPEEVMQSPE